MLTLADRWKPTLRRAVWAHGLTQSLKQVLFLRKFQVMPENCRHISRYAGKEGAKSGAAQLLDHLDARLRFLTKLLQFFR